MSAAIKIGSSSLRSLFWALRTKNFTSILKSRAQSHCPAPQAAICLSCPLRADADADACRSLLLALRDSGLKNDGLLERFYEQVIAHYQCAGNYLILLFHDIYDVPVRAEDHAKLDESEEVYTYLLCAICPVELSKPGLGYLETENRFGPRIRDWVVGLPEIGFLYPAFSDRSSDLRRYHVLCKAG